MHKKRFTIAALTVLLTATSIPQINAQNFVAPIATEYTFGHPDIKDPTDIFSYSASYMESAFGTVDMYLAAWGTSSAYSEFTWQFMSPGTTSIVQQGSFLYQDVADLSVSSVTNSVTGAVQFLVAYYKVGAGHCVDVYDVTNSTATPVVLNTTIYLSSASAYGRISIDAFYKHKVVIVWENRDAGEIETIACENGSWSSPKSLSGASGQMGPDVAMIAGNKVRFVYHDGSGTITESVVNWSALTAFGTSVTPFVEDVNVTSTPLNSKIVLDCPDSPGSGGSDDDWAYTYTDNDHVYVQYMDNSGGTGIATNISVNSGSLGNASLVGSYKAFSPTLHYGIMGGSTDYISVGWYNSDGVYDNRYIGLQMNTHDIVTAPTPGLVSAPDYLELPNSYTSNISYTQGVAYSKSDLELVPNYLYAVYSDYDEASGLYRLHHAFHPWGNNSAFKGAKDLKVATNTYPNPFQDVINTTVTATEEGTVTLQLMDITGRTVAQQQAALSKGTYPLQLNSLQNVIPGTYFLNTVLNGKKISTQIMTK